jgi:hypothetical protein
MIIPTHSIGFPTALPAPGTERTARIQIDLFLERNGYSANPICKFSGT